MRDQRDSQTTVVFEIQAVSFVSLSHCASRSVPPDVKFLFMKIGQREVE
jgi:hypothetical protein